jgi:hypothetical protein
MCVTHRNEHTWKSGVEFESNKLEINLAAHGKTCTFMSFVNSKTTYTLHGINTEILSICGEIRHFVVVVEIFIKFTTFGDTCGKNMIKLFEEILVKCAILGLLDSKISKSHRPLCKDTFWKGLNHLCSSFLAHDEVTFTLLRQQKYKSIFLKGVKWHLRTFCLLERS